MNVINLFSLLHIERLLFQSNYAMVIL